MRTEIKQALFMCKNYARIQCRCFVCHNAVLASPSAIFLSFSAGLLFLVLIVQEALLQDIYNGAV